jgi:uncharacterized protein
MVRDAFRRAIVLPIAAYRRLISPLLPPSCIYTPTCSAYAQDALLRHGLLAGTLLAVARIGRCVDAFFVGGDDPVPGIFSVRVLADGYRRHYRRGRHQRGRSRPELREGDEADRIGHQGGSRRNEGE